MRRICVAPLRRVITTLAFLIALNLGASEVVRVPPWELHNSFWMSLHQTLIAAAMGLAELTPEALSDEDREIWAEAVRSYREAGGSGNLTFADPMVITSDGLTQVADDAREPLIDAPLAEVLVQAAPVYRKYGWRADEAANRFFIAYAVAMLREAGTRLVRAHESVYRSEWPELIRVYASPWAGPYGAYTVGGQLGGVITTIASRDEGYQGFRALEMLLHEASHSVVNPNNGTVADAIERAAGKRGIDQPRNLWHAILFATSSELTLRYLGERGIPDYVPSSRDLLTRAWPEYREPIEKHWIPYVRGNGTTLEEAIDEVVGAIKR